MTSGSPGVAHRILWASPRLKPSFGHDTVFCVGEADAIGAIVQIVGVAVWQGPKNVGMTGTRPQSHSESP